MPRYNADYSALLGRCDDLSITAVIETEATMDDLSRMERAYRTRLRDVLSDGKVTASEAVSLLRFHGEFVPGIEEKQEHLRQVARRVNGENYPQGDALAEAARAAQDGVKDEAA